MADEKVRTYLQTFGFADRIVDFDEPTATVAQAAAAVGCEPSRIAKTLAFRRGDGAVLVVAAGDARVDNRKFRERVGEKARMLSAEETEERTGFAPGGVCPFGAAEGTEILLDESLRRFQSVFPACGTPHSAAELTPAELETCLPGAQWADVCRDWDRAQN